MQEQEQIPLDLEAPRAITSLRELTKAEQACTRCPLYQDATQAVPGEGRRHAHLMLVGEQPGDKEDVAGKPFVGPAGRILDQALAQAGISRAEVFVTNAVKHFKHEMRGKRRLHKRPSSYEIERCKVWLELERTIIKPAAIVAPGVTAARSLFGRAVTIVKMRGRAVMLPDGTPAFVTVHPFVSAANRGSRRQAARVPRLRLGSEAGGKNPRRTRGLKQAFTPVP
jgi:uracil-DNA glycosylase